MRRSYKYRTTQDFARLLEKMETGMSVIDCLREDPSLPSRALIQYRRKVDAEFANAYANARKARSKLGNPKRRDGELSRTKSRLKGEEHNPEFPGNPAGPNPVTLIRRRCEVRQSIREDSWRENYSAFTNCTGKALRFD